MLGVSPPSPSPVARYMVAELTGWRARSEQPITARLSVFVDQDIPPLVEDHKPPAGVPTQRLKAFAGSRVIKFILPDFRYCPHASPLMGPMGPIGVQVEE